MKPFRFRLKQVHELRERAEKQAIESVGVAQRAVSAAEATLGLLHNRRVAIEDQLTSSLSEGAVSADHVQRLHLDLESLETAIVTARQRLVEKEWALEKARQAARKSRVERRATESLREKALERHNEDLRRAEQKDMDETASARHVRGGSES